MRSLAEAPALPPPGPAPARRRVLHVSPYMHPAAGGPPAVVERLASHAAAFHWEASVLTTSLMCADDGRALAASLRRHLDVQVLPVDRPRLLGHAAGAGAAMEAAVRAADIVHVHTLWHPLNAIARRACRRHGKPYVLSPHGMLDPYSLGVHAWRKRLYLALVERRNLAAAARVVFTTAAERHLAGQALPRLSRDEIAPLGADRPPADQGTELAARFLETHPGGVAGRRILYLSRLHRKKGLEHLLAAMPAVIAANPGAHLFVAGSGSENYEASLRRDCENLDLASHVTFTGFLSGEEKWSAMAAADLFVLPSRQENFAIAVAEAMQAGLPVIVSSKVNISPAVAAAGAGIVLDNAQDKAALASAICRLLADPAARRRAGENARALASTRYGWSAAARRIFAIYEAVLDETDARRSTE